MMRFPTFFIPHGGGPCFFLNPDGSCPSEWIGMRDHLAAILPFVPEQPRAILIVSGHWEERVPTVHVGERPGLFYDDGGFPEHTYHLDYAPPGAPDVARRAETLFTAAGFTVGEEKARGWDHGVFVPMMVVDESRAIPVAQLSLVAGLDPAEHIALGEALAPLRDEGVLIVGSGMSFHNMRARDGSAQIKAQAFDTALTEAATDADPARRRARIADWESLAGARYAHPREEHLLPLMVALGAGGEDKAQHLFRDQVMGMTVSAFRFG